MKNARQASFIFFCWLSVLMSVLAMAALLAFLAIRGLPTVSYALFFGDVPPLSALFGRTPVWDGIWPAFAGTLSLVGLSAALAIPVGVACGIHLAEFAMGRAKAALSLGADLLAGVPSIVMGLFGFALILLLRRTLLPDATTCLLLSAICMALLILPYLIKTTQTAFESLPEELRLLGPSLGMTRLQAVRHILLPAAGKGILGGVVLAIGRAAEDTAVILLTGVVANAGLPRGLLDKYEALPFFIFTTAAEHQTVEELNRGFGAALVLLLLTSAVFLGAHLLHAAMQIRWRASA